MSAETPELRIRTGGSADAPVLLELFDEAVAWLVARGQTGQWGSEPVSRRARGSAFVQEFADGGGLRIAELAGRAAGALVVGDAPDHVPGETTFEVNDGWVGQVFYMRLI
jgi:hypothetical protein